MIPGLLAAQPAMHQGTVPSRFEPVFPLRSALENLAFRGRMSWLRSVNRQRLYQGRNVDLDSAYQRVFEDDFDTFDRNKWRVGQPWGNIHPGDMHQWYSEAAIRADSGLLRLLAVHRPARVNVLGRDTIVPFQVGLICSDISFSTLYGYFELRCKLPSGPAVWPAFWLAPVHGWPPEIDIFEMYGKRTGRSIRRVTNSLHFGNIEAGNKGQHITGIRLPADTDKRFYTYACLWKFDCIEFYVNGFLVRRIRLNHKLAEEFRTPMYIIINNGLQASYLRACQRPMQGTALELDYLRVYVGRGM